MLCWDLPQDKAKVESALRRVGFGDSLDRLKNGVDQRYIKILMQKDLEPSGGESQKIAMARALYKKCAGICNGRTDCCAGPKSGI